jgi:hypothetical protein
MPIQDQNQRDENQRRNAGSRRQPRKLFGLQEETRAPRLAMRADVDNLSADGLRRARGQAAALPSGAAP